MLQDVRCPYCNEWQEINHDDGYGYEENIRHEQECSDCGKVFTFNTYIIFSYEAYMAPCLNGELHDLENVTHFPKHWPNWSRCRNCEYEVRGEYNPSPVE